MLLSPNPLAHRSVLFLLTVCVVSAALAGIYKLQPAASASSSRETTVARHAYETSAPAPVSATIVVNSTADTQNNSDGLCTLREAITAANTDTASGATAGECAAGSGSDTIDITGVTGTIALLTELPEISTSMSITGPGASLLTVARDSASGTPEFRVFTINSGVTVSITGLTIANGKLTGTNNGGGILNQGALTLTSCDLYGNSVDQSGGAIYSNGTSLTINDCRIGGLSAGQPNISISTGGGIYNLSGVLSITGGSVVGNSNGGGVFVAGGSATLNGTTITNNSNFGGGGGVTNLNATTTVVNSLIAANSASDGAGVYNQGGTMDVANSTTSGNTATGAGGGARNQSGTLTLTNVTVTNNRTNNPGLTSGGVSVSGTVNLRNTIVAGNFRGANPSTTAGDISGSVSFGGSLNNLIGTGGSGGLINGVNGNRVGVFNPGLGLLANNGGLTETHALLVGSLALDGGNNTLVTNPPFSGSAPFLDQRGAGFKRILDAGDNGATQAVDIGAYEANPMIADIPNTSINEDGSTTCLIYNVGDDTEGFSSIVATSSNQSLVQDANLNPNLPGALGSRCLAIGLEPNQFGTSTIAITLTGNNGRVISDSFLLTVNAIGDAPSVTPATTSEDTQTSSGLVITKNPADGPEVTQFYITNIQNGTLYKNNGVTQILNNSFITLAEGGDGLKFTPAANLNSAGDSFGFTVQAATNAGVSSAGPGTNASITVDSVNDPPSFTKGADLFVNQQPGGYTIANWATNISAGAPNESGQVLTFEVTGNTNSALFSVQPAIDSAGTLTFTGAANTTGTSSITIHLKDNGGGTDTSPSQTFTITITSPPVTPVVNTLGDAADINIGDRVCDSDAAAGDQCTLRAALQETNATGAASGNTITFSLPSPSTINLANVLPDINTTLTVTGPGANSLTVQRGSGAPNFRIFSIGGPSLVVSISGLTIANGNLTGTTFPTSYGAGIYARGTLTLTSVTLSGNNAGASGGAIVNDGGNLTINSCLLTNNVAGLSGGGLSNRGNGTATVNESTFSSNSAAGSGGGISNSTGDTQSAVLTVTNSTFSNNSSQSGGGGVFNIGTATLTNVTISSNSAAAGGGINNANPLTLNNVTIANNSAANQGGGMYNPGIGVATINNSMLAANTSPSGPDCSCANLSGDYNLYSSTSGATVPGTHNVTNTAALIGPLANNGGLTLTHALLPGSPALDAGNNAVSDGAGLTTDQRGAGFSRKADSTDINTTQTVDIGAFEAHASVENIPDKVTPEDTAIFFNFQVADATLITGVSASSSNTTLVPNLPANISVTGSGATRTLNITPAANQFGTSTITVTVTTGTESMSDTFVLTVTPVADLVSATDASTSMNTQTAAGLVITRNAVDSAEVTHFKISNITNGTLFKNDGTTQITNNSFITFAEGNAGLKFTPANNLTSPSSVFSFQVQGATSSGGAGLGPAATATITVNCGSTVVTNTNDSGPGSLRSTINAACPGANITFNIPTSDPGFVGGVYHITLTSAELVINKNLTISGLGPDVLTVRRSSAGGTPKFRIFTVSSTMTASISGMTITNGSTADGVQPLSSSFGNPGDHGGGIMNSGVLTLTNMTITGNRTGNGSLPAASSSGSNFGGSGGFGGGVYSSGQLTMSNVTVSDNTTGNGVSAIFGGGGGRGGGIFVFSGSLTMTNCLVSGNVTGIGAISTNGASSGSGGGGGGINIQVGTVTITNTSIINNTTGTTQVASPSNSGSGGEGGGITIASGAGETGTVTIVNSTITGNRTGDSTGFSGQAGRGAGLNNGSSSNLTIIGTTISGNQTGNGLNGGEAGIGAGLSNTATTKIINSTISGNISGTGNSGAGPGIWNAKNLFLTNSTVVLNTGGTFGGAGIHQFNDSSAVTLRNTIIAGNTLSAQPGAADLSSGSPAYNSQGHNLIGNADGATGFSPANGDQLGTMATPLNPRLSPLANNGGVTLTHALLPGSPALDAGNNCVTEAAHCGDANIPQSTTDQRGFNRVVNSTVDIGSFESRGFTISVGSGSSPQTATIGSTFGSPLVATVSSSFAEPVAGGVITFSAPSSGASGTFPGSVTSITASANGSGVATSPAFTANLISGSYNVTAGGKGISTAASFSLTNSKAASSTSVSSSVNPSEFGENVTFTATVSTALSLTPTGTVQFKDGAIDLGSPVTCVASGNTCTAQFSISTLSVGDHNISATYSGDGNLDGSIGSLSSTQVVKAVPTLSINDVSVTEGNSGTANLTFTVTLSAASNLTVSAGYATANGTATTTDNDYQSTSGTVTFNPGDLTKTVTVLVTGDQKTESDETVFVVLSNPVNAAFSDSQGQGTILNDDTLRLLLDTSGPDANQLAALDSLLQIRDPFRVQNAATWFTSEPNTRVVLFALNLQLNPGDSPSVVKVMMLDGNGQTHEVAADDVQSMANTTFAQVTFRLPDMLAAGTCQATIKVHDRISNTGTFRIAP